MKNIFLVPLLFLVLVFGFLSFTPALQAQTTDDVCAGIKAAGGSCDPQPGTPDPVANVVGTVIDIFSIVVIVVAVIMIIIGGFKYITSSGDSNNVSGAKNTILYAIIGLVIVALAQVIVRFVLNRVPA